MDDVRASVHVEAPPEVVYRYFTETERMLEWMGQHGTLDARAGGRFEMSIGGTVVRGEYLELDPPRRVVFSWGHVGSERLPPRTSTVEVELEPTAGGTRVQLVHRGLPAGIEQERHARGWTRYLDRLAGAPGRAGAP